jgi:adenosylcobinamide-GDP ribazoletransferase
MLKEIGSLFSFLTIIPTNNSSLETVAKYMYIFPIIGLIIGGLVGGFGYGLAMLDIEPLIVSLLVVTAIVVITGVHHTDGLADFADGLMVRGTKEKKLQAMKDVQTGSAGIVSIVLYIVALIIALSIDTPFGLFKAILLGEVLAKFSMVLMASIGQSAALGSNSPFVQLMKDKQKLAFAGTITIIPLIVLAGALGMIMFAGAIVVTLFLTGVATRSFGGITGDVLGATNELTRLSSILIFVSL